MCNDNCAIYWDLADYFPVDDAIQYWCDGSATCIEARRNALLSALDRGNVKYRRRDGKSFDDSVYELFARHNLLVERESFLVWATSVSSDTERQNLQDTVTLAPKAETNYLMVIGALLELVLGQSPGGQNHSIFSSQSAIIENIVAHHDSKSGLSKRNLEDKFAAAKRQLQGS